MTEYNGHKNYNAWNVSLWLFNDEALYNLVMRYIRFGKAKAAAHIYRELEGTSTPDGVPFTKTNIRLALKGE